MRNWIWKRLGMVIFLLGIGFLASLSQVKASEEPKIVFNCFKGKVYVGDSLYLSIEGYEEEVSWKSGNKKIATINKEGKVTFKKHGKVKISAILDGEEYFCYYRVLKAPKKIKKTEEEKKILKKLKDIRNQFPEGMDWGEHASYTSKKLNTVGYGCAGLAFKVSDLLFGEDAEYKMITDFSDVKKKIRIGDFIRVEGDTHFVIVVDRDSKGVKLLEGNFNEGIVHWGERYSYKELKKVGNYYYTRYPR